MLRITRFRMVTSLTGSVGSFGSFGSSYTRNAACVLSVVVQPLPSRIAGCGCPCGSSTYSPTKVLPVFGLIDAVIGYTPLCRQKVVAPTLALMISWIDWPGKMSAAPAGHVIAVCGPIPDICAVELISQCLTVPGIGSPNTAFEHCVPPVRVWTKNVLLAP